LTRRYDAALRQAEGHARRGRVIIIGMNRKHGAKGVLPRDWLLVETVRRADEASGDFALDDPATREAAREPVAPAGRIVKRARLLETSQRLLEDIDHVMTSARWLTALLVALGLLSGVAAASGIQSGNATIALSHAVLVLLGVPFLLLLAWATLSLFGRKGSAAGLPGRILWWLMLVLTRRFGLAAHRRHLAASVSELGRLRGRTLMALATHAFWTMFFVGCIGWLWLRFLGLRFDFSWETTLLSGRWLEDLIIAVGWLPAWLFGLALPSPEQAQAVLSDQSPASDRGLWAGYLIGALVIYGFAPRALLAAWFLLHWRRTRLSLDLSRPGYLRLLPVLGGPSQTLGSRGEPPTEAGRTSRVKTVEGGTGSAVLVGVELDHDETRWPPDVPDCRVLGRADNRRQRGEIMQALELLAPRPEKIVALCSLARSPDRGTMTFLGELAEYAPLEIRLADAHRLADLGIDSDARLEDWRESASRSGLPRPVQPAAPLQYGVGPPS